MAHTYFSRMSTVPAQTPVLILDPSSLGYHIQGMAHAAELLDNFPDHRFYFEVDKRLVPLFERSFGEFPNARFLGSNASKLPNDGKPQMPEQMAGYYAENAERLAGQLGLTDTVYSSLLLPEVASPFNAGRLEEFDHARPIPGYLHPSSDARGKWIEYLSETDTRPILISWNKQFSQHGQEARQNLDPSHVSELLFALHERGLEEGLRLKFFNAVHAVSAQDLENVNARLPGHIRLEAIKNLGTKDDFNLGQELDLYSAFMSAVKDIGGGMVGVGNTYQHMFYAASTWHNSEKSSQVVVLPDGSSSVERAWQLHDDQMTLVKKSDDFAVNPTPSINKIASLMIDCLPK